MEIQPYRFESIYSLGHNCQVAAQLKRNGLRRQAGPWDWFNFASAAEFCGVIRRRFEGFMQLEHLEAYGKSVNNYYVRDRQSTCLSFHDFKNIPNQPPLYDYVEFRERLDRRIARFNDCLSSERRVLLVRIIQHQHEAEAIYASIHETYANPHISMLFILHGPESDISKLPSFAEDARLVRIPRGRTWEGDTEAWAAILSKIRLE
ncbi:peptidase [Paenibacillus ihbetae]|uniref:Peptidase n=1 Tax=Paenibacillus ihbetae TaxID=1870820 RepID=A0A1B2DVL4_9BACL|nr:DUF1796 family putative cysteine peptidase [Paenibacillus ihbetae]ANY71735.1 peptidase [Paenibacillus ihbetae]